MRVAYVTPYYNGACDGRYGRFHDWVHTSLDMEDPPFDFDVYPFTVSNPDETLATYPRGVFGEATELWGSKLNKAEYLLNAGRIRDALQAGEYDLVHVLVMDTIVLPTVLSAVDDAPVIIGPDIAGWSPVRQVPYWEETLGDKLENRLKYFLKSTLGFAASYGHAIAFSRHHRDILASFSIPPSRTSVLRAGVDHMFHPGPAADSAESDTTAEETDTEVADAVAPNGGDPAPETGEDSPELLYVGDFSGHKGYPHFLEALSTLDRSFVARLIGAGDPDEARIRELGLTDDVIVEGFVPRHELPEYYRRADLYVVPTIDETAGTNTQIESLACGTPVLVTDNPGVNEWAPPDASVTFSPREVGPLRDALERALDTLPSLQAAALESADEFRAEHTVVHLSKIYENVRENPACGPVDTPYEGP